MRTSSVGEDLTTDGPGIARIFACVVSCGKSSEDNSLPCLLCFRAVLTIL